MSYSSILCLTPRLCHILLFPCGQALLSQLEQQWREKKVQEESAVQQQQQQHLQQGLNLKALQEEAVQAQAQQQQQGVNLKALEASLQQRQAKLEQERRQLQVRRRHCPDL